jgi:hypothetical protein
MLDIYICKLYDVSKEEYAPVFTLKKGIILLKASPLEKASLHH